MVSEKIKRRVALRAIEMINEQIEAGKDIDGKPYTYSTKPFAQPYQGKYKAMLKKSEKAGITKFFNSKSGSLWFVTLGGYRAYRELLGRDPDGDFLQFTGKMLKAMTYKMTDRGVQIVFSNEKEALKAYWQNVAGVGKSKKLWKWFGLNKENQAKLSQEVAADVAGEFIKKIGLNNG